VEWTLCHDIRQEAEDIEEAESPVLVMIKLWRKKATMEKHE
jgi:hypothetical protein